MSAPLLPDRLIVPACTVRGRIEDGLWDEPALLASGPGVLVHGRALAETGRLDSLLGRLPGGARAVAWRHPGGEPTLDHVSALLETARATGATWIAGVGGGSVMDLAKACAALARADGPVSDYHDGRPIETPVLPWLAAPATAGTGSEATVVTVLTNPRSGEKKSFRHAGLMARRVVLDASLLVSLPAPAMAASALDALVQAIEAFVSRGATGLTDLLALKACEVLAAQVVTAVETRRADALGALLESSYLAGIALSHARLGLVHGLAHPLGARWHQPHGLVCAACLAPVLRFNRDAVGPKYAALRDVLGTDPILATDALLARLDLRSPFAGAVCRDEAGIVRETLASGSTKANPRAVTEADVRAVLAEVFAPTAL